MLLLFLSGTATLYGQEVKTHKDSPVKFEVLSVRLASPEEWQSDNIGMDVIVRFRLSNKGRTTVYFSRVGKAILALKVLRFDHMKIGSNGLWDWKRPQTNPPALDDL